jgi:hypothetical protein
MTVHFASGAELFCTPLEELSKDHLKAFAKVIENIGSVPEIRFCSVLDGRLCFVYVMMSKVDFLEFTKADYEAMQKAVNEEEKPKA